MNRPRFDGAYDNWQSVEELPFIRATQLPALGRLVLWAWSRRRLFCWALATGKAVYDPATLTGELVDGYTGSGDGPSALDPLAWRRPAAEVGLDPG